MLYKLVSQPSSETHAENIIRLFVRDANGAPVPHARVKVWAGPPPSGYPAYWNDDLPFRTPSAAGMLEFIAVAGPMPEDRDYWLQVVDEAGTPQSEAIQFHFRQGSAVWLTATVQQGETSGSGTGPHTVTVPLAVQWDARLTPMHVTIAPAASADPGQPYWKIIAAQFQDEGESGGNHNLYCTVLDEKGIPVPGIPVQHDWVGRETNDIPNPACTDGNGTANVALYGGDTGWRPDQEPGPYTGWVGDPDLRGASPTGIPGEKISGIGLPMKRHVNYVVTWRKVVAQNPPETKPADSTAQPTPAGQPAETFITYTIRPGDTLTKIAREFGVSVAALATLNNIANPNLIRVGHVLKIPKTGVS